MRKDSAYVWSLPRHHVITWTQLAPLWFGTFSQQNTILSLSLNSSAPANPLPTLLIGAFIAQVDSSIVLASSKEIASSFHALSDASWLITSYVLAQCATQALYGKLSDIFGRKVVLVFAYSVFTLGGIGNAYWKVLLGQAISGVGGAGMIALVAVIIADILPVREIATWRSYVNVIATLGRSCGGPIGGWLVDTIGWRWCFLGQCPYAALAVALVLWKLPGSTGKDSAEGAGGEQSMRSKASRVDLWGVITLPSMLAALFVSLDRGGKLYAWYYTLPIALLALVLAAAFYYVEKVVAEEPILPMELLAKRDVAIPYAIVAFQTGAQFIASTIVTRICGF
ncbi:Uu.00g123430.m01.CDS01 [Anthostomella pinea]|uniref:Uu.00g123430.m01.CDS01 n=1 Tax=Anthostomella pinea TaxID=933095 RepID=A0AAI8YHH5_9PEZI|nr:Uu.00g123430.m01.CDS01 [Anthostomella pinea]